MSITYNDIKTGTLIDVRSPEEFADGHHPLAINIPLDQLEDALARIRGFKTPIYACCKSGVRSGSATQFLNQSGISSTNVGGWHQVPTAPH